MSNNTILKALDRMGYKGVMTGHGFRGLASTLLHAQGYARVKSMPFATMDSEFQRSD